MISLHLSGQDAPKMINHMEDGTLEFYDVPYARIMD